MERPVALGALDRKGIVMRPTSCLLAAALLLLPGAAVASEPGGTCAAPSKVDRAAILDAVRPPVTASLRTPVEFVVERIRVCGDWGFVVATPQKPGGGEPRWAGTVCDGDTSHLVGGLARRDNGVWRLLDYALCPSDVAWADWPTRYGAPERLFAE